MKHQTLVIRRAIAAPREQVFDYLTIPEKIAQWFYGSKMDHAKAAYEVPGRPAPGEFRGRVPPNKSISRNISERNI